MLDDLKKVIIIGAGGGANYYVAKLLTLLGIQTICFDIKQNEHTKELQELGAEMHYNNPESLSFPDADLIVFTNALPKKITDELYQLNPGKKLFDAGTYYELIVKAFEKGDFTQEATLNAIRESNIAPLYNIDFGNCVLISVTGSKGKTTTSQMIYDTLNMLGAKVSLCNTIGGRVLEYKVETGLHTSTPSAQELAVLFKEMLAKGSEIIVLEASSHAIATGRISGLKFDIAVLTNLQPEHMDFHGTIEHVINTKKLLVTEFLKPNGKVIINIDDENIHKRVYPELHEYAKDIYTISLHNISPEKAIAYSATNIKDSTNSVGFDLGSHSSPDHLTHYIVPFAGEFNVYNVFPAIIIAELLGFKDTVSKIKGLHTISGRNEVLQEIPFKVILDFAHTPESLEVILRTYRNQPSTKKLIIVFGSAGQRDALKRPRMGIAAAKYADVSILTIEDPRSEDIKDINAQIESGWTKYVEENHLESSRILLKEDSIELRENSRTQAIRKALTLAKEGDVVICAGKGPEKSMCIGLEELPWNEKEVILEILKTLS